MAKTVQEIASGCDLPTFLLPDPLNLRAAHRVGHAGRDLPVGPVECLGEFRIPGLFVDSGELRPPDRVPLRLRPGTWPMAPTVSCSRVGPADEAVVEVEVIQQPELDIIHE